MGCGAGAWIDREIGGGQLERTLDHRRRQPRLPKHGSNRICHGLPPQLRPGDQGVSNRQTLKNAIPEGLPRKDHFFSIASAASFR